MPETELKRAETRAVETHPRVRAVRFSYERLLELQRETEAFTDPSLQVAAGGSDRLRSAPAVSAHDGFAERSWSAEAGVEAPLPVGAYLFGGVREAYLRDPDEVHDDLVQSVAGIGMRVPLLRDRGLKLWRLRRAEREALSESGGAALRAERQAIRHGAALSFIDWLSARAEVDVARDAAQRLESLYQEARGRAALKVLPAYQVAPARMEWILQREQANEAESAAAVTLARLRQWTGEPWQPAELTADALVQWAARTALPEAGGMASVLSRRGGWEEVQALREAAGRRAALAEDSLRPDVALEVSATWQGEDEHGAWGDDRILSDRHGGGQALLVWRGTWGRDREQARLAAAEAETAAYDARLADRRRGIERDLRVSTEGFSAARERLAMVDDAVSAARETLEAERERFRLGEGRSRNVLDAQKDLTDAVRRQNRIASELLLNWADYRFAAGYPQQAIRQQQEADRRETSP